jgi:hypothetical protein
MIIDQRSDTTVFITINGWVYYIDDSTNEQIIERWRVDDPEDECLSGSNTNFDSRWEQHTTSYKANRTPDYAIVISRNTDAIDPLRPFVVHTEIFPDDDGCPYYVSGQYDMTLDEAQVQYWARIKQDSDLRRTNNAE